MSIVSELFLNLWFFLFSQIGIFALGCLFGGRVKREVKNLIDRIDGKIG